MNHRGQRVVYLDTNGCGCFIAPFLVCALVWFGERLADLLRPLVLP